MPLGTAASAGTSATATTCPSPPVLSSANVTVTQPTCTIPTGFIQVLNAPFNSVAQLTPNAPKPSGGNAYLFSYLVPGTYSLTLTVNGCTSAPYTVVINPAPAPPVLTLANVRVTQPNCTTTTGFIQVLNPPAGATAQLTPNAPKPSGGNSFLFSYLPPGTYSLTLTVNGCTSAPLTIVIKRAKQAVTSFTLVDADTDTDIMPLTNGMVLNLATLPTQNLSVRANTTSARSISSVVFSLHGPTSQSQTELYAPYTLFGDNAAGDYFGHTLALGRYESLSAQPYSATGCAGTPLEIAFSVINEPTTPGHITYTLVNANTGFEFMALTDGATLNLATLPTRNLNIRANTNPATVGRVEFELGGTQTWSQTEFLVPYALFGDNGAGDYTDWTPAAGSYVLTATSYAADGTAGTPHTITFDVIDGAARIAAASSAGSPAPVARKTAGNTELTALVNAYPNPSDGQVSLLLPEALQGEVSYTLVSALGAKVSSGTLPALNGATTLRLDFSRQMQASGVYMLHLTSAHAQAHLKLLRR
ncbi:T9SS type A sorting domain-containing protein [Hymenobacter segetis]